MPLTSEQLDNWFNDSPPTPGTEARQRMIRNTEEACHVTLGFAKGRKVCLDGGTPTEEGALQLHGEISRRLRHFAMVIDEYAPDSADKSAAIRCVRLARDCAKEAVTLNLTSEALLWTQAHEQLRLARFQANAAIACGGK